MLACLAAALAMQPDNTLTRQEKRDGWILLFDGKTTKGWHSFKQKGIQPGWTVKEGVLAITDAEHAGDIVTDGKYDWFELQLDWNVGKGQNSGVMLHVADDSETIWTSGPEVQIYDDHGEPGAQKNGWLYDLYDSKVDSTHPAGQWNHFRILVTPEKCETDVNGVKYYEWVWGSNDFWARVAASKFHQWPEFAKLTKGTIGLQGDHGLVQFKNIKLKPIKVDGPEL
ncbi:MAG TPA: DUF1080 domain-containing protein [Fimbriimonadaceae bacterium]|nr:DUF1080 domain-containing protein [Fimbriimonadaceae bacterium]